MKSREELKPCPFCGGEATLTVYDLDTNMIGARPYQCKIECSNCDCSSSTYGDSRETKIEDKKVMVTKLWNTRKAFFLSDMEIDERELHSFCYCHFGQYADKIEEAFLIYGNKLIRAKSEKE